jgi:hypothetical protein
MRILVTGMTNQQAGEGTRLGYEPVADLFAKALITAGHVVHRGVIAPGTDLDGFDVAFVGIVPPLSIASKHLYSALWTIAEAERRGLPLAFYLDDWAFPTLITKLGTCARNPHHLVKEFFSRRPAHAWAVEHVAELSAVVERLLYQDWPPTLIPTFTWGDHDKLMKPLPMVKHPVFVDPSAFARDYPVTETPERDRQWVLGTVSDQRRWLESLPLTWPVRYVGSRSSKADEAFQEKDLVQLYRDNRGVLSPPYRRILGTGWWRNRYVYAAQTRAVVFCGAGDVPGLDGAYDFTSIRGVEDLGDIQLDELAEWQSAELFKFQATRDQAAEVIARALARAVERVK